MDDNHYGKLSAFIEEDGSFSLDYAKHGTLEVDCDDGECSIEVVVGDERYEGTASTPEDLYDCLYSAVEKLKDDDEEAEGFLDTVISHMDVSNEDDFEGDDDDDI